MKTEVDKLIMKTLNSLPESFKCDVFKYRAVTEASTYIVFNIWNEHDLFYAGDEPIGTQSMIAVNIYSDDENKKLICCVKSKLRKAGFSIISTQSIFNDETERIQTIIELLYEDLCDGFY